MAHISNLGLAFAEVLSRHGERTALIYPAEDRRVSYAELGHLTEQAALRLSARGLRAGQVLALLSDKSPHAYALILACLRLGLPYTHLDPDSPVERLRKILSVSAPALLVNACPELRSNAELAELAGCPAVELRQLHSEPLASTPLPATELVSGSSPAYLMFTSGSTGTPKGAVMSHANVLGFIAWSQHRFSITPDDVLTNVNPMYFDNSVFDFYSALFSGATLMPVTVRQLRDTRLVVRLVKEARCTVWFSVPSMLIYLLTTRALTADDFPSMRKIVFGGEGFPKPKLKQLFDLFGARVELENVYGPTECTCICSAYTVSAADFDDMAVLAPLGKLAQNFDYEIIPSEPSKPDFGELFLRGPLVGLGYYRDPERTAAAFQQNPRHVDYHDRGYRTGDLVERDALGMLHFRGRADFQIKHMGYRIELEEVEFGINTLAGVRECGVIYRRLETGFGEIVAHVAAEPGADAATLQKEAARVLPPYMLPRRIVLHDNLPKNANGKIDRKALV
jgi:D-alanine--poly(phosphoribitol) ligase subunit 1